MPSITDLVRWFGTDRAMDNVRAALATREREDWLVATLTRRLDDTAATALPRASADAAA